MKSCTSSFLSIVKNISMNSSTGKTLVSSVARSVVVQCLNTNVSISFSQVTSCSIAQSGSVPGHWLQLPRKHSTLGGLHYNAARLCQECLISPCVSDSSLLPAIISLTFWWIVQTHTECVPLPPAMMHSFGRS